MPHTSRRAVVAALAVSAVALLTCGGSSTVVTKTCTPGESKACAGANACDGFQVCSADGSRFEGCQCGGSGGSSSASTAASTGSSSESASSSSQASTSSAGTGGGGWTPKMLSGLALWFNDDVGLVAPGGNVQQWLDQSGNGNDATATNGIPPTVDVSVLNGHDAVIMACNSTLLQVPDSLSLHWGAGDFALTFVAKASGTDAYLWHELNKPAADPNYNFWLNGGAFRMEAGMQSVGVAALDPPQFEFVTARGQALQMDTDAVHTTGPTNTMELDPSKVPIAIGECLNQSTLEIAEVVAVKGALSDADLKTLEGYLKMKFKL